MKNLGQIALDKIKKKNIKPYSRWKFVLKNYFWWFVGVLSILFGSFGSSVVFYMLINNDWDIYKKINSSLTSFIFITMPYFWFVFLILFIILADYYLKHTKYGYRFSLRSIVFLSIFISVFLGGIFYQLGMGQVLDKEFSKRVPGYTNLVYNKGKLWMHPEKGLLAGTIIEIKDNNNFMIEDLNGKDWKVIGDNLFLFRMVDFSIGNKIKLVGKIKDKNIFMVHEVRPWFGKNHKRGRGLGPRFLNK